MFKIFKRDESGQSMVLVALMLTVLMGFGALAIDIGYVTYQKSELQNAADAAALAGAASIPIAGEVDYIESTIVPQYLRQNIDDLMTLIVDINKVEVKENTVEINISQKVPRFLGGILTKEPKTLEVRAKAKYTPGTAEKPGTPGTEIPGIPKEQWNGEALPFVNFKSNGYNIGTQFEVWDKVSSGFFGCINNYEIVNPDDPQNLYFQINISDGLRTENGTVADKKQEIKDYYNYHNNTYVYIFSLSPNAIADGQYKLKDGTYKSIYDKNGKLNLENKAKDIGDYIDISSLVLVECSFDKYVETGKDSKSIYLTPKKVYDVANGDWPPNYINPAGDIPPVTVTPPTPGVPAGKPSIKLIE